MVASMIHTFPLLNVTSQETAPSKDMGLWFKKNDMPYLAPGVPQRV